MRRFIAVLTVVSVALLASPVRAGESAAKPVQLFNGQNLDGWDYFLVDKNAKMADVWSVKDGILVCKGKPGGYLCTKQKFENFKLVVEWRWPGKPGNSGVLMRLTGKPTMLPHCVEAQLAHGNAGDMYGFENYRFKAPKGRTAPYNAKARGGLTRLKKIAGNEKKPGEWNRYEITAKGGTITLLVNGKQVNQAVDCEVRPGQIALQSEGGVIQFRTVTLTPLKGKGE